MKLPRDVRGVDLVKALEKAGYAITRQSGSHIRLTLASEPRHHITVPAHQTLRIGTLAAVLDEVGDRLQLDRAGLLQLLNL